MSKIYLLLKNSIAMLLENWPLNGKNGRKSFDTVATAGVNDNKQKEVVVLHLIGPARQEIFHTLSDTGDHYESAVFKFR